MDKKQTLQSLLGSALLKEAKEYRYFIDGAYNKRFTFRGDCDLQVEALSESGTAFYNVSAGMGFFLPVTEYRVDYTINRCRTKITFGDCIFAASAEDQNPYLDRADPWFIYGDEWLMRHLNSERFLKNCNIRCDRKPAHLISKEEPYGDLNIKAGYDVYRYSFYAEGLSYPYYEIAVVRKTEDFKNFALFVMKSLKPHADIMDGVVESLVRFAPSGVRKNYFVGGKSLENPRWSDKTRAYFQKLQNATDTEWGVFTYSMPGEEAQLFENNAEYQRILQGSITMQQAIEAAWQKKYDIFPTYTHIGRGADWQNYAAHHFPLNMARTLAGGDGENQRPVLQFTYQFTLNNNLVHEDMTPMFDILRGRFDEQFRRLARDIKAYGYPVLFRLNNEMNTDWTSYCGMMTLLDPDIFNETWIRLYKIFEEEGVDNCIWIWNPIATTCPYCGWGEDLCYFPGKEYVQLLGGTSYEMNNYPKETAAKDVVSFRRHYEKLYSKNGLYFPEWSVIISEFACGSGGDASGELGRNRAVQAEWVKEMFEELNKTPRPDYAKAIKGAVWFNCNDVFGDKIGNYLRFLEPATERENATTQAFRQGFSNKK